MSFEKNTKKTAGGRCVEYLVVHELRHVKKLIMPKFVKLITA